MEIECRMILHPAWIDKLMVLVEVSTKYAINKILWSLNYTLEPYKISPPFKIRLTGL